MKCYLNVHQYSWHSCQSECHKCAFSWCRFYQLACYFLVRGQDRMSRIWVKAVPVCEQATSWFMADASRHKCTFKCVGERATLWSTNSIRCQKCQEIPRKQGDAFARVSIRCSIIRLRGEKKN